MKRTALMKEIAAAAKAAGVDCYLVREGANHEVWQFGTKRFTIPRHRDINELTADAIRKQTEEGK